jgi:hypothetical protein
VDPAGFTVLPGSWSFFATGPTVVCSPGPAAVPLDDGANDGIVWATTTLRVNNAPAGGLWGVERSRTNGASLPAGTCPGPALAGVAVPLDGARTGALPTPAGDWFVYVTSGGAGDACVGTPTTQYSIQLPYGQPTTLTWPTAPALTTTLTVTRIDTGTTVVLSKTQLGSNQCRTSGDVRLGPTVSNNSSLSTTVPRPTSGTQSWYVYLLKNNACSSAGGFQIGTGTVQLSKSAQDTTTVTR